MLHALAALSRVLTAGMRNCLLVSYAFVILLALSICVKPFQTMDLISRFYCSVRTKSPCPRGSTTDITVLLVNSRHFGDVENGEPEDDQKDRREGGANLLQVLALQQMMQEQSRQASFGFPFFFGADDPDDYY